MKRQILVVLVTGLMTAPLAFAETGSGDTKKVGEQRMSEIDPMSVTCTLESGRRLKNQIEVGKESEGRGGKKSGQAD